MLILHAHSLLPVLERHLFVSSPECSNRLLIAHISPLSNDGHLHLVERAHKELLVVPHQQLLNALQLPLSLADRVDVDALNEHLDQGCRLRELSPGKREGVQ